ncbi:uncharacterized protein EAF02_009267 [Botrytis sinoallii]|uniref:uncharacterized protein n=1 Tax=Botrytis sinoallii TaxID=1463999 RepID=UPI001900CA66|nr:uncharacterized protein EAF02_009267 [Botrytis sinoallii]KAF7870077.1 hypothetical protein EAF02_009267 [Botrytis sinoallii]
MATQPHDLTVVAALFSAIEERNALLETIKRKDAMLETCQAQLTQRMNEKISCERAQTKLAKCEKLLEDNGIEGVEEVICKLEYLNDMVEKLQFRAKEVEESGRNIEG